VTRVELEDLAPRAHALERERRRAARGDHDAQALGQMAHQGVHHPHDLTVPRHLLEVVEHQQLGGPAQRGESVGQRSPQHLGEAVAGARLVQCALDVGAKSRLLAAESLEQIAAKHHHVGIRGHERVPHHRTAQATGPGRQQRGLAEAGVGDDQGERPLGVVAERLQEPRTLEDLRTRMRLAQLHFEERRRTPFLPSRRGTVGGHADLALIGGLSRQRPRSRAVPRAVGPHLTKAARPDGRARRAAHRRAAGDA